MSKTKWFIAATALLSSLVLNRNILAEDVMGSHFDSRENGHGVTHEPEDLPEISHERPETSHEDKHEILHEDGKRDHSTVKLDDSSGGHSVDNSIVIGPNFSQHTFDSSTGAVLGSSISAGIGYSFGTFVGFDFFEGLGMEFGLLFVKRTTSGGNDRLYHTTTLNIPLMLRAAPFTGLRGLKFELGSYLGVLSMASITQKSATVFSSANADQIDYGAMGGLSYFAPIGAKILFRVSAYYVYGLADIASSTAEINNRGFDTYLGVVLLY